MIVLAFFAQRLISPPSTEKTPTFNEFRQPGRDQPDQIETVTFEQKTETVKVVEADRDEYSTGYPPDLQASLVNQLDRQGVETTSRAPAARASSRSSPTSSRSSSSSASGSS